MNGADRLKPSKLVPDLGKMHVCKLEFGIADQTHLCLIYQPGGPGMDDGVRLLLPFLRPLAKMIMC